jgi:hypothetical protein
MLTFRHLWHIHTSAMATAARAADPDYALSRVLNRAGPYRTKGVREQPSGEIAGIVRFWSTCNTNLTALFENVLANVWRRNVRRGTERMECGYLDSTHITIVVVRARITPPLHPLPRFFIPSETASSSAGSSKLRAKELMRHGAIGHQLRQ